MPLMLERARLLMLESDLSRVEQEHTRLLNARSIICIGPHTQLVCSDAVLAASVTSLSSRYNNWVNPEDWDPVAAVHLARSGVVVIATSASSSPPGSLVQFNARTAQREPTRLVERWAGTKALANIDGLLLAFSGSSTVSVVAPNGTVNHVQCTHAHSPVDLSSAVAATSSFDGSKVLVATSTGFKPSTGIMWQLSRRGQSNSAFDCQMVSEDWGNTRCMCSLPNGHTVVFAKSMYIFDPLTGKSQQVGEDWGNCVAAAVDGPVLEEDLTFGVFAVTKQGWSGQEGKLWHIRLHKTPGSGVEGYSQAVLTELAMNDHLGSTLQVVVANHMAGKYF